ncbi:hypothetical protein [Halioxenophilus sp. WMMB6]|uniref:hypothetical protein n=1 Tax=Halioxenophilus sp. WMMB6 TaxID=3073815 RepID=UPI00295EA4A5|nr:hypothetical protein [Halioxenophilus sp. WMMB6]
MDNNIYKSPDSNVEPPSTGPKDKKDAPVLGVVLGAAVDIGGTVAFSTFFVIGFTIFELSRGVPSAQVEQLFESMSPYSGINIFLTLVGACFSVAGGYVCASKANRKAVQATLSLMAISSGLGFLVSLDSYSLPANLIFSIITAVLIWLGALAWSRRNRPKFLA